MKLTHEELEKKLGDVLTDEEYDVIDAAVNEVCGANENLEDQFLSLLTDPNNRMLVRGFVTVGSIFKMALLRYASESEIKVHTDKAAIFKHKSRLSDMNGRLVYFVLNDGAQKVRAYGRLYEDEGTRRMFLCNDHIGQDDDLCPGRWGYRHALRLNAGYPEVDFIDTENLSEMVCQAYPVIERIALVQPGSVYQYEYTDYHVGDILSLKGSDKADLQVIARSGSLVVCNNLNGACATMNYTVSELSDTGVQVWVPARRNWMDLHEDVYAELFGLSTKPRHVDKA